MSAAVQTGLDRRAFLGSVAAGSLVLTLPPLSIVFFRGSNG